MFSLEEGYVLVPFDRSEARRRCEGDHFPLDAEPPVKPRIARVSRLATSVGTKQRKVSAVHSSSRRVGRAGASNKAGANPKKQKG
jgi:hypothetical protein